MPEASPPPPADFASEWTRCRPWIEAAVAYCGGTHDIDDVLADIAAGEAQFWPGRNAAVVTQIGVYPKFTGLHLWLCGGNLAELVEEMRPAIEAWGAAQGCVRFTTAGRQGWQRVMKKYGYAPLWNICVKG